MSTDPTPQTHPTMFRTTDFDDSEVEWDTSDAITVAFVHRNQVDSSWHHCMDELRTHDMVTHQRIMRGGYISLTAETDGLAKTRNKAVKIFLEEGKADYLAWIDTDMGFVPETFDLLMEDADPETHPIVGALAFGWKQQRPDGMGGWRYMATPTIFDWGHGAGEQEGQEGFIVRWGYRNNELQECSGTGSACLLIHRSVFEKIRDKFGEKWYDRVLNPKMKDVLIGEDLSFCLRAAMVGCPVFVDTRVKTTHAKTIYVSETDYFSQQALAAMVPEVPPATESTAVIVPVLGRPQNAKPFMESLRESLKGSGFSMPCTVYAVIDESLMMEDMISAEWTEAGAEVIYYPDTGGHYGTFAEKVNWAYQNTEEPWLFLTGDDVKFHPGWLDQAQHAARDGAHVIGTNDLKNPRVVRGEHATHLLIRRAYVDERGASWDGPGKVCHEYGHWYVDDEIVTVAKQRQVWVFAQHSKVEHFHPLWGDGEMDETYELGKSRAPADKEMFEKRVAEYVAV